MIVNAKPKYDGESVYLNGVEYVIPGLSLKQAKVHWGILLDLQKGITLSNAIDKLGDIVTLIHAAMSRNYPELTYAEVEEMVDLNNIRKLVLTISGQSGLTRTGPQPAANSKGVKSIGSESTAQSLREPAGALNTPTASA